MLHENKKLKGYCLKECRVAELKRLLKKQKENILFMAGQSYFAIFFPMDIKQWVKIEEAWGQILLNCIKG